MQVSTDISFNDYLGKWLLTYSLNPLSDSQVIDFDTKEEAEQYLTAYEKHRNKKWSQCFVSEIDDLAKEFKLTEEQCLYCFLGSCKEHDPNTKLVVFDES